MTDVIPPGTTRRELLTMIGTAVGSGALYLAMTGIGQAAASTFVGPPDLQRAKKGSSVLVLGAGLAGMLAAYELRNAGYSVRVLEYQNRAGGRNWSLYGGDTFTELGGATQNIGFAPGNYLNPGPWRIPYHHHALLYYIRKFNVAIQPFIQVNYNAYVHNTKAYGGKPQRYRPIVADFQGGVAEMLAKSMATNKLDVPATKSDYEAIVTALREWGGLTSALKYEKSAFSSNFRGWDKNPGAGKNGAPIPSDPLAFKELVKSGLYGYISAGQNFDMQESLFQPAGGMGMIGKAFAGHVHDLITFNVKVNKIAQDDSGVTVTYFDNNEGGSIKELSADWCICTIPLSVLDQIEIQVKPEKKAAISAVHYLTSVKTGLEFKRRFWEEDDSIYGGMSFTNQDISIIGYPNEQFQSRGKGVILGMYAFEEKAFRIAGMSPERRIAAALKQGSAIHPQYYKEFDNGASVAWNRVPWTLGCCASWDEQTRKDHYQNLISMDNRIVLAGEACSYVTCWQEGALLSSIYALSQLNQRASAT